MTRALAVLAVLLVALAAAPPAVSDPGARVDAELRPALSSDGRDEVGVVVHFREGADRETTLALSGVGRALVFENLPSLASAHASPAALRALASSPAVERLEADLAQTYYMDTAPAATRVTEIDVPPPGDGTLDGSGVGIAIVDSGIDATHPDLPWGSKVAKNLKFVGASVVTIGGSPPGLWQDVPDSDTSSGHGTHVAGIAAGTGKASDGKFRGIAPGATVYGFGAGETLLVTHALAAFDWILGNHDSVDPPIRIVSNSWGTAGEYDAADGVSKATVLLVEAGLVVLFAAGNDYGDGSDVSTNLWANNPTPGVVSVANYDDEDSGSRDGDLAPSSSRGSSSKPETWPDVSAPGTRITSALAAGANLLVPVGALAGEPTDPATLASGYVIATGTSMATPHVAGVVALMLEADAALAPAEVESRLERTAHKFGPLEEYAPEGHFARGHGLVDASAALLPRSDVEPTPVAPAVAGAPPARDGPAPANSTDPLVGVEVDEPARTPLPTLLAGAALAAAAASQSSLRRLGSRIRDGRRELPSDPDLDALPRR